MEAFFSVSALIISLISLLITIWLWRESNRPVVSARIKTHKGGNVSILYNIELINCGTRPAKDVRIFIEQQELDGAILPEARVKNSFEEEFLHVKKCFEERAAVPILLNGETISNAFGHTSIERPFWRPGATMQIKVYYMGLEGQRYESSITIKIDDTAGFAGAFYEPATGT